MTAPRKSSRYIPELAILLRDAELRADEWGDPVRRRARDVARDELLRMYREADEAGTLAALKRHRETVFDPAVAAHNGRVVKLIGEEGWHE